MSNRNIRVVLQSATNVNMILNFGRNIAELLQDSSCKYHIIYSSNQSNKNIALNELKEFDVTLHECPIPQTMGMITAIQIPWTLIKFYLILRKIQPDIIHTRGTLIGFVGRIAAKLAGVKFIYHHQDDFLHREEKLNDFQKWFYRNIDSQLAKLTTKIFFVSKTIVKEAISLGIDGNKCKMVGHDLSPLIVAAANTIYVKRHPIVEKIMANDNTVVVGSIGRIEDFKGIDTILAVASQLKSMQLNIKFLIRGNGSKLDKYAAMIETKDLRGIVHLVSDYLPADEIPWLFKSFDIFFLPTRREGFGMVFAEAMCMKVPVIAPKIYPVVDVVPEELGILIEPEDIDGYYNSILDLYFDKDKREGLAEKSYAYSINRWGSQKSARKVVKELLDS